MQSAISQFDSGSAQVADGGGVFTDHRADISMAQLRSACEKLLAVIDTLESQLDTINGNFGGISTAAASYLEASEQIVAAISQMEFSDADISTLNTLLSRSAQSADVTTYLFAEISALHRILDKTSSVDSTPAPGEELAHTDQPVSEEPFPRETHLPPKEAERQKVKTQRADAPCKRLHPPFCIYRATFFFRAPLCLEVGLRFTSLRK